MATSTNQRVVALWHYVCPECGISPIFTPMRNVRTLYDWFTPLDGCPICGYAYEREQGYFLLSIWGLNYGLIAGFGTLALPVVGVVGGTILGTILLSAWKAFDVIFIGFIQAFIFMLLTVIYFGMAREGLEHEHH